MMGVDVGLLQNGAIYSIARDKIGPIVLSGLKFYFCTLSIAHYVGSANKDTASMRSIRDE